MKQKKELLLSDIDGCSLDWQGAFEKFLRERGLHPESSPTQWDFTSWLNLPKEKVSELIHELNS